MKLDSIDVRILGVLLEDGRASLRDVARETSLTTPTVSSHFSRLMKAGLIRKFAPILNLDVLDEGIIALITLKAPPSAGNALAKKFAALREVAGVYVTAGEHGIILKVHSETIHELERFLKETMAKTGCELVSSQIVSSVLKDEQPFELKTGTTLELKCDLCKGPVSTNRPYNIKVGTTSYYFCCKTCRRSYLDKHGARLKVVRLRARSAGTP